MSLVTVDQEMQLMTLEEIAAEANLQVVANYGPFKQGLIMAAGMRKLQEHISDSMMDDVMQLQGSTLGFRTDKDSSGGYQVNVVRQVFIESVIRGLRPVGNEFNIIGGRLYITKEGFARLVPSWPGISQLKLSPGVPQTGANGALVPYRASWMLNGKQESLERLKVGEDDNRIPVRVNAGMGVDAIIGKATRKMYAAIYGVLTGLGDAVPEGEVEDAPRATAGARRSELTDELPEVDPDPFDEQPRGKPARRDGKLLET